MLRFSADLFRIAFTCTSNEETRYYLRGVFVEPHPQGGVTLTATDGHRLVCIRDEKGHADESAILNLKDGLKACRSKRNETRVVIVDGADARIVAEYENASGSLPIAAAYGVRIDGSFPDYRRVIPAAFSDKGAPGFQGTCVSDFGVMACDLASHLGFKPSKVDRVHDRADTVRVLCAVDESPEGCPALIVFPNLPSDIAFGVLMPVRMFAALGAKPAAGVPSWFRVPAPFAQAAE
jgi:hypothetical protein